METQTLAEIQVSLAEHVQEFGPELVQWIDVLSQDLAARGNSPALDRLTQVREEAVKQLAVAGLYNEDEN
jgi:hypothetical protein